MYDFLTTERTVWKRRWTVEDQEQTAKENCFKPASDNCWWFVIMNQCDVKFAWGEKSEWGRKWTVSLSLPPSKVFLFYLRARKLHVKRDKLISLQKRLHLVISETCCLTFTFCLNSSQRRKDTRVQKGQAPETLVRSRRKNEPDVVSVIT